MDYFSIKKSSFWLCLVFLLLSLKELSAFIGVGDDNLYNISATSGDYYQVVSPAVTSLFQRAKTEIFPPVFSDTLAASIGIITQYSWKSFPDNPNQSISAVYDYDPYFGALPILRIDYDVSSYSAGVFNGYALKINTQDFSQDFYNPIVFYIRGDPTLGFTRRLKIEFKNSRGKVGSYIIEGISENWQKITIDKTRVGRDFSFRSDWQDIEEIVLVFEEWGVTAQEGRIYLAGFTYPESWQVASAVENIYAELSLLSPDEQQRVLSQIVGPGVAYSFKPLDIASIKNWILSSQEHIANDSGIYSLNQMLRSLGSHTPSFSDLRIAGVVSSLLAGKEGRGGYNSSLYDLYRSAQLNGHPIYAFRLPNFSALEDFFNKTGKIPLVAELKTGEFVLLNGFERGGFLWLTKFVKFDCLGEEVTMSEQEFTQLWTGNILSLRTASSYQPLANEEVFQGTSITSYIVEEMLERAKELSNTAYHPPEIKPVSVLDPPLYGRPEAEGLVYQEYLAIGGDKFYDDGLWWFQARPRGSQNKLPLKVFLYDPKSLRYSEVPYDFNRYNYSRATPPITYVPPEGRYITALDIGHILVSGSFPQFFTIGGDGYMRFVPLTEGREMGASFRVAGQNITHSRQGGDPYDESFPIVRELYVKKVSESVINLVALVDAEGFTGVLDMYLYPQEITRMEVDARFFMRRDMLISQEPDTGFAGFSSMFFLGDEKNDAMIGEVRHTPWNPYDEAHDSDYLVVHFADGSRVEQLINRPFEAGRVDRYDFSKPDTEIVGFSLQQRDRNPSHYRAFPTSDYTNRPSFDLRVPSSNIPLSVKLYEISTDNEYVDNIVAFLTMGRSLYRGEEVHIRYEVTAYDYPG
ncbi:MAG: glucan biosynthesis protein [Candidatus Omnitrophica bacterium]|nr:glucan biosynthesis protein [Candidatus Omnitrophota bacterium]